MSSLPPVTSSFAISLTILASAWLAAGCSEVSPSSELELRKDEHGRLILYKIGSEEPYTGPVEEKHENSDHLKCRIDYVDGLREGNFTFWNEHGLPALRGNYKAGLRNGLLQGYGEAGEKLFEKSYLAGKLDGRCTFYYPVTHATAEERFRQLEEHGEEPNEAPGVAERLRFAGTYRDDLPDGNYTRFFPDGQTPLETGRFKEGNLVGKQVFHYPQITALGIKLPAGEPPAARYRPDEDGFGNAIKKAYEVIKLLPAYRNPEGKPALVMALDSRENEIMPLWDTRIVRIEVVEVDGGVSLSDHNYTASLTGYKEATSHLMRLAAEGNRKLKVVGLDRAGHEIDVFLSSYGNFVIPLPKRLSHSHRRLVRVWREGKCVGTSRYLPNGMWEVIRDADAEDIVLGFDSPPD